MIDTWDDLNFFRSKDFASVEARLDLYDRIKKSYNPKRELIYAALDETPFDTVKVAWIGQDPYPNRKHATGILYAVPNSVSKIPPTLSNIFSEYMTDLHLPVPAKTDLTCWTSQGVLMWNSIPTCFTGLSLSHDWPEWQSLTSEIVSELSDKGDIVFILQGRKARNFASLIDMENNSLIETVHPSPRAAHGFFGCRLFSNSNRLIVNVHGKEPIAWEI